MGKCKAKTNGLRENAEDTGTPKPHGARIDAIARCGKLPRYTLLQLHGWPWDMFSAFVSMQLHPPVDCQ